MNDTQTIKIRLDKFRKAYVRTLIIGTVLFLLYGFLFLYLVSNVDPTSVNAFLKIVIGILGIGVLILIPTIGVKYVHYLARKHHVYCPNCNADFVEYDAFHHVLNNQTCPRCGEILR